MLKRVLRNKGFSVVGVIVAAGMMGGLALFLADLTKQQQVSQRKAETGVELTGLYHKINSVLYDGESCTVTLGIGSSIPMSGTNQTRTITQLKNKAGTVVVRQGSGGDINRMLRVESIVLKNVRGNTGMTREADMEFVIKRLGAANKGHTTVKKFPLTIELQSLPNTMARCHHTLDAKEEGIKEAMCMGLGGTFVASSGSVPSKCSMDVVFRRFCVSLQGTYTPGTPIGTCNIADKYVDTAGDVMTGPLRAPSGSRFEGNLQCQNISCSGSITAGGSVTAGGGVPAPLP